MLCNALLMILDFFTSQESFIGKIAHHSQESLIEHCFHNDFIDVKYIKRKCSLVFPRRNHETTIKIVYI